MNNSTRAKKSVYEQEQRLYFKYVFDKLFDKVKGLPVWKQYDIVNKALLSDPAAPKFTVFSPPGMHLMASAPAPAPVANNNASSVSSMGIRFSSRGGRRRATRRRSTRRHTTRK
jgi:hypothetical protein